MPRSEAGGWLRMNPLDGLGVADANVTAFRFALIECDGIPFELQMPLLAKLPLPIAVILGSGGRSLHAWVKIDASNADEFRRDVARMLALLAKLGVDTARLSRLPGVVRRIGADGDGRQRLFYLNPQPKQKAIL
jgi:regulatory protein RepA